VPLCNRCREVMPPHFVFTEENGELVCAYCKTGRNVVTLEDEQGNAKEFTKQEIIGKYKEFAKNVLNRNDLQKRIVKGESLI
jgi:uncharacterized Zn finger protein (UPF0148 family)